jgi:hypothetical protein
LIFNGADAVLGSTGLAETIVCGAAHPAAAQSTDAD